MTHRHFQGVYPILYAFYGRDGKLDRGAMRRQVEACVASGAHGLAILGLITEGARLSREERLQVLHWAAADLDGRLPLAVTVGDVTIEGQVDFLAAAKDAGAAWAILQPPPVALALKVGQQIPLPRRERGLITPALHALQAPLATACPGAGPLTQPAGRQGTAQGAEQSRMTGGRNVADQVLPGWAHGRTLQNCIQRPDGLLREIARQPFQMAHHQAAVAASLQADTHQIPNTGAAVRQVGVGKGLAFGARLQPHLNPGGERGRPHGAQIGVGQSCKGLIKFLQCASWAARKAAVGTGQSSVQREDPSSSPGILHPTGPPVCDHP
jgi:hypothetical protein